MMKPSNMFLKKRHGGSAILTRITSISPGRMTRPTCNFQDYKKRNSRFLQTTSRLNALKPYLLADIGEGITECQIISWAVKQGDVVQQFDPICEVQSDKASVEITSRFDGTIEKLHYEEGDVAKVGWALLDIDVPGDDEIHDAPSTPAVARQDNEERGNSVGSEPQQEDVTASPTVQGAYSSSIKSGNIDSTAGLTSVLTTPAVRRLLNDYAVNIADVHGTGKDGRVLKDDVTRYVESRANLSQRTPPSSSAPDINSGERRVPLSPIQSHMFKTMTASLSIPHFLYTHTVDLTSLAGLVKHYREDKALASRLTDDTGATVKLTVLPFVLKALSQAASRFPAVNSSLDAGDSGNERPELVIKNSHDFGLAVDTPNGLLVPVIRNVQSHSVLTLASEISRLARLAKAGKLSPDDMQGASLVVSNIGSIGGNVVGPVILSPMTAIMAIGQMEEVPAFETDKDGVERIVKKNKAVLSWSADHRVLDGATMARCAQEVAAWLEKPELLGLDVK